MSAQADEVERVLIQATLTCKSELHIGSGQEGCYRLKGDLGKKNAEQTYSDVCLDYKGMPCIPASTLRGYLARQLNDAESSQQFDTLFGCTDVQPDDLENNLVAGKLRVYDASYIEEEGDKANIDPAHLTTRTAIEAITATSKEHQLFTYKVVCEGSQFLLKLELDRPSEENIQTLLMLLANLDGSETSQIGKSKSLMMGRLAISDIKLKTLSTDNFIAWLQQPDEPAVSRPLEKCFVTCVADTGKAAVRSEFKALALSIYPTSPLLVNDVHLLQGTKKSPKHVYTRRGKKLCIPASTLRGLIRGHCRKILLTLLHNNDDTQQQGAVHQGIADNMLEELFGGTKAAGLIRVSDAISVDDAIEHAQTFIAVDRFTGGAADGALYNVEGAIASELPCKLYLHSRLFKKNRVWAIGLFILVLRDAMEGDLSIGWGKSRGFGAFEVAVKYRENATQLTSWEAVLKDLGVGAVEVWVKSLHKKIKFMCVENKNMKAEMEAL